MGFINFSKTTLRGGYKFDIFALLTSVCCISNERKWSIEHHASTYSVLTHTLDPWVGIKRSKHYCSHTLKKGEGRGYTGFWLSNILPVCASVGPSGFCFRSISLEQINRISPNSVYALISTSSRFGLYHTIFVHL